MRRESFLLIIILAMASVSLFAQLKISQYGGVGMGIEPRSDYKLILKGDLMLTTFPEIPTPLSRYTEFRIKVGNGSPGCEFGTPTRNIAVWSSEVGYNNLYAGHYYTASDTSIKSEIATITNPLELVLRMNAYSYKFKYNTMSDEKKTLGFLAQEIYEFLPDIIDTAKGIMLLDYQQIIPLIVGAIKEQQDVIDSLINANHNFRVSNNEVYDENTIDSIYLEVNEMKNRIMECCNRKQGLATDNQAYPKSTLFQNHPNPFSKKTIIEFLIVEEFNLASIMVFDMQGKFKAKFPIFANGKCEIEISEFELTEGMYFYSLLVDDIEIDTKRMILAH